MTITCVKWNVTVLDYSGSASIVASLRLDDCGIILQGVTITDLPADATPNTGVQIGGRRICVTMPHDAVLFEDQYSGAAFSALALKAIAKAAKAGPPQRPDADSAPSKTLPAWVN